MDGNALDGATFISTSCTLKFYYTVSKSVNALDGATFISTIPRSLPIFMIGLCVNALEGATFISTMGNVTHRDRTWSVSMP